MGQRSFAASYTASSDNYKSVSSKTLSVTVNKAASSVQTAPVATNPTYTGSAKNLVKAGTAEGGELQYSLDGTSYAATIPQGTKVDDYTVWYKVAGDANHTDTAAQSITSTISALLYNVQVASDITGGSISVVDTAAEGDTVEVKATPKEGYVLS